MKKEYSPEVYNYNKYPGQQFVTFEDKVKSDETLLTILENTADTFDAEAFTQRFSEVLLKFDYIVGDWGNEQLRLKGFYKEAKKGSDLNQISHLQDYLKEYCNYGCHYFILQNDNPQEIEFEVEEFGRKRKKRNNRKPKPKRQSRERGQEREDFTVMEKIPKKKSHHRRKRPKHKDDFSGDRGHFTIRQKG